jgi:hypothetical protein
MLDHLRPTHGRRLLQGTLGQANFFSPFGRVGEGQAGSRPQTALGQHTDAGVPANSRGLPGTQSSASASMPQITGASGYSGGSPGDSLKSYNPNTGNYG